MITYYLLIFVTGILGGILLPFSQLPNASLPPQIAATLSALGGYLATIYGIAPFFTTAVLSVGGVVILVEGYIFSYKLIMWIVRKIPGIN